MTFKTILRSCGASALVGAMALAALPSAAHAEDNDHHGRWQGSRSQQNEHGNAPQAREQRAERQAAPQQQQQQRTYAAPQQRQYAPQATQQSQQGWNRRGGGNWDRSQVQAQAQAQAQAQVRAEAVQRSEQWQRNRSYADGSRNTTYRAPESRRTESYRTQNTYNNTYRTQSYRDGQRWDGNRDSRYDRNTRYNGGNYQRWSNDWRRDNRYNWSGYRNANRSVFHLGTYYAPYRNYRYSRVGIGFYLDSLFFGSNYWINDPWQYRLPEAYGPYRWVRYYDDALLVDVYSGEVVDVIYDFFW